MPLYDYRCAQCGSVSEVRHGFGETHSDPCPKCGGPLNRVFNPAPIVFKGSGFYATDSRKSSAPASDKSEKTTEKTTEKTEKPAEKPAATESKSSDSAA